MTGKAILRVLFSCPSNRDYTFLSDYLYKHQGLPGAPALACFWHRGEQIDGVADLEGGHTEISRIPAARVDSLASTGRRAMDANELDRARLIFRNVARQRAKGPDAYIHLGHILLKLRRFEESKDAFHRALRLGSKAEAHYGLGMLYKTWPMQRHFAIYHFTEALIKDRNFVDARFQMAKVRYDMKERDAELEAKRVLEMDPEHAGAYLLIANYYLNFSWEFEKAVVWYTKYLALHPEDADAQRSLGIAYLKVKDYSKIMDHLFDFVQRHPNSIELMPIVAISAIKQDSLEMAMRFFKDYISNLTGDKRRLYEDISQIASGEELSAHREAVAADRADYLRRFWNSKDPDLSTSVERTSAGTLQKGLVRAHGVLQRQEALGHARRRLHPVRGTRSSIKIRRTQFQAEPGSAAGQRTPRIRYLQGRRQGAHVYRTCLPRTQPQATGWRVV